MFRAAINDAIGISVLNERHELDLQIAAEE